MAEDTDLEAELLADSKTSSGCSVCMWIETRDDAAVSGRIRTCDEKSACFHKGSLKIHRLAN